MISLFMTVTISSIHKIYLNKSKLIPSIRESENRKNCYVGGHEAII